MDPSNGDETPPPAYPGYPPPMPPATAIPPVSVSGSAYPLNPSIATQGSAYPPYPPMQTPYANVHPPTNPYPYGYPPYPITTSCPYPVQTPIAQRSDITPTTAAVSQGAPRAGNQLPYPIVQNVSSSASNVPAAATAPQEFSYPSHTSYPAAQNPGYPITALPYLPMSTPYPPQTGNQGFGLIPPPIGISIVGSAAADAYHLQGAPSKRIELGKPTVKPATNFDALKDARELENTLEYEDPNKDILISILCHRSSEQRFAIAEKFKEISGQYLAAVIESKFEDNFQKVMLALLTPRIEYYVKEFQDSLENYDTDSMIDIMCLLSNYEMYTLKYEYEKKYGVKFETALAAKTSVHLKRFLLELCECKRDETGITNLAAAENDAQQLAKQGDPYDNEHVFYYEGIFSTRSFQQIKLISEQFQKITGKPLETAIKDKFIIDDKQGYLCIVRYSQDKRAFFAKRLNRSMAGLGTNDNQLIRLIVTRCEIDLQDIKETYQKKFGKSLRSWIKGDTSGYYKYALYALIGEKRSN